MSNNIVSNDVAIEQEHVSLLYRRLDELRAEASGHLRATLLDRPTNHQARSQRDATTTMYWERIAQLDAVENGLCFGRLDFANGDVRHIGRIGIHSEGHVDDPLLVDWRAPSARPFYLATVASPEGVSRRRQIQTRFRKVVSVEDEALDATALRDQDANTARVGGLSSESALISAVSASRTGSMRDIVETIQKEQDEIIRSDERGVLVVEGGPGTGKTAVALHRAAYLLYHHRESLSTRAVLIVGPNPLFLRYIGRVLPGLGETAVVLSTIGDLFPGVHAEAADSDTAAEIKGRAEMAEVLRAAVRDRQRVPDEPWEIEFDRETLVIDAATAAEARRKARSSRLAHNQARPVFTRHMIDALAQQIADRVGADILGGPNLLTEADLAVIRDELQANASVTSALNELWPNLSPQRLMAELYADPLLLEVAAPGLSSDERKALYRQVDPDFDIETDIAWTSADVPLLDEAAELLGVDDSAEIARAEAEAERDRAYAEGVLDILSRDIEDDPEILMAFDLIDAGRLAERQVADDGRTVAERAAADRQWAYGHVIVDEAQELSAMAWRMLMRRCPSRSMTVVGDTAQTSEPGAASSWALALEPFVEQRWRLDRLTVNYRTPAEIVRAAEPLRQRIAPDGVAPRAIRSTGVLPWRRDVGTELNTALRIAVEDELSAIGDGRLGILAPAMIVGEVRAALGIDSDDPDLTSAASVLTVRQAKGLEFDSVLVVEPRLMLDSSAGGEGDLYVALTRATKRLGILHSGPIPDVLSGVRPG